MLLLCFWFKFQCNCGFLRCECFILSYFFIDNQKAPQKINKHRAMDDIKESIAELKFYQDNIFKHRTKKWQQKADWELCRDREHLLYVLLRNLIFGLLLDVRSRVKSSEIHSDWIWYIFWKRIFLPSIFCG